MLQIYPIFFQENVTFRLSFVGRTKDESVMERKLFYLLYNYLVTDACTMSFLGSASTITRFLLNCSWTRITFSVPLTMKYPPGSRAHSFSCPMSLSLLLDRTHLELRSMIGKRPMVIPFLLILFLPLEYSKSTMIGAAYVMSRSRHSFGVTVEFHSCRGFSIIPSSRRQGFPT